MMIKQFFSFIKEYNIVGLALAFIMGGASNSLVKSLVDNMIMPFVNPLVNGGKWQEAVVGLGPIQLGIGAFLSELLHFLILAWVVFIIAKKILKEEEVKKK